MTIEKLRALRAEISQAIETLTGIRCSAIGTRAQNECFNALRSMGEALDAIEAEIRNHEGDQ